jgi:hypothetical protein
MSYGSRDGAMAYIKHMSIGSSNYPSEADIQTWLDQRSAILDGWLAQAGYTVPVTTPASLVNALDYYANIGAAANAELTLISAAYTADTELRRETVFLKQFAAAEAWILSGAPAALGAVQDDTPGPFAGLRVSGTGGDPIFRKSERLYDIDADQRGGG